MQITFEKDIKVLFRVRDIAKMITFGGFDLSSYSDVVANSAKIVQRLRQGDMPCDGRWAEEKIAKFEQWISEGHGP